MKLYVYLLKAQKRRSLAALNNQQRGSLSSAISAVGPSHSSLSVCLLLFLKDLAYNLSIFKKKVPEHVTTMLGQRKQNKRLPFPPCFVLLVLLDTRRSRRQSGLRCEWSCPRHFLPGVVEFPSKLVHLFDKRTAPCTVTLKRCIFHNQNKEEK